VTTPLSFARRGAEIGGVESAVVPGPAPAPRRIM